MKFRKLLIIPAICGMVFVSCEKDNDTNNAEVADTNEVTTGSLETLGVNTDLTPTNLDQATLDLIASKHLSPIGAQEELRYLPDGTSEKAIRIEGDIVMTKAELEELEFNGYSNENAQYSTNALVSPQTITIIGYTGGSQALTSSEQTAL
jgi:hypothetical protein